MRVRAGGNGPHDHGTPTARRRDGPPGAAGGRVAQAARSDHTPESRPSGSDVTSKRHGHEPGDRRGHGGTAEHRHRHRRGHDSRTDSRPGRTRQCARAERRPVSAYLPFNEVDTSCHLHRPSQMGRSRRSRGPGFDQWAGRSAPKWFGWSGMRHEEVNSRLVPRQRVASLTSRVPIAHRTRNTAAGIRDCWCDFRMSRATSSGRVTRLADGGNRRRRDTAVFVRIFGQGPSWRRN